MPAVGGKPQHGRRMKLLIVILNYNVTDLSIDCLRSLEPRMEEVPGARVALVENVSAPEAAVRLRQVIAEQGWGAWVDLIEVQPNRGFTGGNNIALRAAMASDDPPEYFLLLNSDTLVLDGALSALVDLMDRRPRAGIAGSRLLDPQHVVQASPFRHHSVASELDRGLRLGLVSSLLRRWSVVVPPPDQAVRAEWVSGASMILRRTMLEQIGLGVIQQFYWCFLRGALGELFILSAVNFGQAEYWANWLAAFLVLPDLPVRSGTPVERLSHVTALVVTTVLFIYTRNFWLCALAHSAILTIFRTVLSSHTGTTTTGGSGPLAGRRPNDSAQS